MTCKIIGNAIVCSRTKWEYCQVEGCCRKQEALCDFPMKNGTCDFRLCYKHRKTVNQNKDYCPKHNLEVIEGANEKR